MSFQFKCPQGHLLEGDPSHAGQQCHCPVCGMLFIIPAPLHQASPAGGPSSPPGQGTEVPAGPSSDAAVPAAPSEAAVAWPHVSDPTSLSLSAQPQAPAPGMQPGPTSPTQSAETPEAPAPIFGDSGSGEEELLHIPCPNGHELETPREMLGQDVLCPYCQAQFRLREKDSVEFKRKRAAERERKERQRSRAWFNWAIVALVLVVLGILFLVFSSSG